jgi:hypothetical protein
MVVSSRLNVSDPRLAWSMRPASTLSSDRTRVVVEQPSAAAPRPAPLTAGYVASTGRTRGSRFASPSLGVAATIPNVNAQAAVHLLSHMAMSLWPGDARRRKKLAQRLTTGHTHHTHESWTPSMVRFRT